MTYYSEDLLKRLEKHDPIPFVAGRAKGIKEVVDYLSRHWMGSSGGMLLYELPDKDRDLLGDGIVPS